jgi:hypothetical protein
MKGFPFLDFVVEFKTYNREISWLITVNLTKKWSVSF